MNKDEFIKKWCPETFNSRMMEVDYKITYDPEFQSDLNTLLTETAEKTRKACAEYYKSNCKDFDGYVYEVILHTPLT